MKHPDGPAAEAAAHVGILLLSHGPLADALRDTVQVLEPEPGDPLGALSLAWDEAPEFASERLQKAIAKADRGRGVVLLTDMFGGTPSNLALAFLQKGRVEIVTGVNLPMVVKARALSGGSNLLFLRDSVSGRVEVRPRTRGVSSEICTVSDAWTPRHPTNRRSPTLCRVRLGVAMPCRATIASRSWRRP